MKNGRSEVRGKAVLWLEKELRKNMRKGEGKLNKTHMESQTVKKDVKMKVDRMWKWLED